MESKKDKVIIVEDDAGLLELLSEKLIDSGCDVFCAISSGIAFNWLKDNQPTLMLLDYSLPDMNGSEFISELTTRNIFVPPFILATGQGDERIAVQMMKLGARDYIVKDTNYLEFIPIVVKKVCKEIENENKLKFAEQEVIRVGKHYQAIIEKSPDGFVLLNQAGEFEYISPSALRMFGYDESEISSIHPNDLTHPEDLQLVLENIDQLLHSTDFFPIIEYRLKHKNGDWIWIESTFSNLLDDPNVGGTLINFRNISERKNTEKALKLRENYLTAIIENLPGLIWLKDVDSNFLLTNTGFVRACGIEKSEYLVGKSDFDVWPKKLAEKYVLDDKKVINDKVSLHNEELIFDQHTEKWFETFKTPILDENGLVIGTTGYSRNITERKLSELKLAKNQKELAELFDNAPVGYHEIDSEGKIVRINQTELDLLGYKREELIGKYVWKIAFDEAETKQRVLDKLAGKKKQTSSFERDVKKKDGSIIHFMVQDIYLQDEDGKIIGIRSTFQDITERKISEALLKHERELYLDLVNTQPAGIYRLRVISSEKWAENAWSNSADSPYIMELASDQFCQILGVSRTEFKNNHKIITDLIHPDDLAEYEIKNKEANIKQIPFSWDCRLLIKGIIKWVHLESFPRKLENGDMIFTGILYDITERKQAEEKIRKSEILHRTILETALSGFLMLDKTGNIKEVNQSYSDMSGFSIQELLNMNISDFETPEFNSHIDNILNLGLTRFETKHKRRDNTTCDVDISVQYKSSESELMVLFVRDITERKKAEEAIKTSLSLLNATIESTADGILVVDLEGKATLFNHKFVEMWGIGAELLESRFDEQLLRYVVTQLADPDKFLQKVTELYKSPELTSVDNIQLLDGRTFVRYSIPQKIGEAVVGRVWSFHDVTERLKIEESLKASEDKYRTMIEQSNDLIWSLDTEGNFLFVNEIALKSTGLNLDDWLGKSFVPLILPEDLPMISEVFQQSIGGKPCKYELRLKKQDESILTISVNTSPIWDSGKIKGVVSFGRDITEQKKAELALQASEELYRNLVERIPDGVYKSTPDGKFVEINPAMVQMLGYESKEELLAIDIKSELYFSPEDRQSYELDELHEEIGIFQLKKKDGTGIWIEDHGWYSVNENNKILYHEGVLRDITDRKIAEEALEHKIDEMTRFHNLTVDRELKMIELKKEINELLKAAGKEARYVIVK